MRRPSAGRGRLPLPAAGTRGWLLLALGLGVLALGLPWGRWSQVLPGTVLPGSCVSTYDADGFATLDCVPGAFYPGLSSSGVLTGGDLPARVLLVLVALLVWRAYRRRDPAHAVVDPAAGLAVALGVLAVPLAGAAAQTGQVVWVLALAALVVALRRDGLLGLPDRLRTSRAA